ncbi:MAG: DNA-directed RNA polymerase subunit alpha, partial [Paludibacteraceae bacterium]|nr:DNA-directed RNA polymerase subunit alpha [Paludibacteraceae bacterium]
PEQEALLDQKVTDMKLTVRTLNILKSNDIYTVRDLVRLKKLDWIKFRNGGKKSLAELDDFIQSIGLQWGMNV